VKGTTNVPEVSVIIRRQGKILFVLRQRTGYADGKFCLPAGHVEHGESFSAAAARETLEEVNVVVDRNDLHAVHTLQRRKEDPKDVRIGILFEAAKWSGDPKNMEPERHGEIAWFDAGNLPFDKIIDFQGVALRHLTEGKTYAEDGWESS
jgi:8-oxo-dGTP diphosphatase